MMERYMHAIANAESIEELRAIVKKAIRSAVLTELDLEIILAEYSEKRTELTANQ